MTDSDQVARLKSAVADLRATVRRLDERNKALAAQIARHNESKRERAEAAAAKTEALQAQLAEHRRKHQDNTEAAAARYQALQAKYQTLQAQLAEHRQKYQDNTEAAKERHQVLLTRYQAAQEEKNQLRESKNKLRETLQADAAHDRELAAREMSLVRKSAQSLNTLLHQEVAMLRGLNGDFVSPPTSLVVASTSLGLDRSALDGIANLAERSSGEQTPSLSARADSPIIVVGCPRSGTTLLQALICSHNDTWPMTPEASPITVLAVAAESASVHADRSPDGALPAPPVVGDLFGGLTRDLLATSSVGQAGTRPVLKHPVMTAHLPKVLRLLPDASIVAIVRDPRAIFASCRSWGARAVQRGAQHPYHSLDDLGLCHLLWGYLRPLAQLASSDAALSVIRYEKLVVDPEAEMARVAPELALTNDFKLSENWKTASPVSDSAHITSLYGSPPTATSLDSWRTTLSDKTQDIVGSAFAPWIEAFEA